MNYIEILSADLIKGYSKSDLELLIGLPKNSLSGVIKGDKKLSKISELKIEKWEASEKPSPLQVVEAKKQMALVEIKMKGGAASGHKIELSDLTEPTNIVEPQKPMGSQKTNFTINTTKPERLAGETSLDYRIRCEELKSKTN